jgi:hypothetical protein
MRRLVLVPCVIAGLLLTMALGTAGSASANTEVFCSASNLSITTNNQNKCWGQGIQMTQAVGFGVETGACIGADAIQGTCTPSRQYARVIVPAGVHYPWMIGTGSTFTHAFGETY